MKRNLLLIFAGLLVISIMSASASACGNGCSCRSYSSSSARRQQIIIRVDASDLPGQAARFLAQSVKQSVKFAAHLPGHVKRQMRIGSDKTQFVFHAATRQTQSTFQRISAGVTTLSLQLLRGVCSYFWALISGLLR